MKSIKMKCFAALMTLLFLLPLAGIAFGEKEIEGTGTISGDIFEKGGRYYHAFLSLYGAYDDNIFNIDRDEESDFITVISPGIQLAFPATRAKPMSINTATTTSGGLVYDRFEASGFQQFQSYLAYNPRIFLYAENEDENTVNHEAQGSLQYNLRGGLSFSLVDRFVQDFDRDEAGISTETDTYRSNLANLIVSYAVTEKTLFRVDYSNFIVFYTDAKNEDRNRMDNAASGYLFFKIRSKTSLFAQYTFIDINYDETSIRDSREQRLLGGVYWNMTEKTKGSFRIGYGLREFDDKQIDDAEGIVFEARLNYQATPKTSLGFGAFHRNEETPDLATEYVVTSSATATYRQKLTDKFTFEFELLYRDEDYQGGVFTGGGDRSDQFFSASPSIKYAFRDWISAGLTYGFRKRESNEDAFDYTGNRIVFEIRGAI
ncbi:MAG TPA: DUF560 domain-containing protein [Desulfobacterales bacterium]|nr:DUF560 domain-containing protein [Desulfobacterales bacterium]